MKETVIIGSPSYEALARSVAAKGGWKFVPIHWGEYPGGAPFHSVDRACRTLIRDRKVVIIGGTIHDRERHNVLNLASSIDRLELGPSHIMIVNPCMGSQRDDKQTAAGQYPAAKLEMREFSNLPNAGNITLVLCDLHNELIAGFGEGNLKVASYRLNQVTKPAILTLAEGRPFCVGSVDTGGSGRVDAMAEQLGVDAVYCLKRRKGPRDVRTKLASPRDEVEGKVIIAFDDIGETCTSMDQAAGAYRGAGAIDVRAVLTHGLSTPEDIKRIKDAGRLSKIAFVNTHPRATELAEGFPDFVQLFDATDCIVNAIIDPYDWDMQMR